MFELRDGQLSILEHGFVLALADEFAARKEGGRIPAVLQLFADFGVSDAQSHAAGLREHDLFVDQVVGSTLGKERKQHGGLRSATRELLADHCLSLLLDFDGGDVVSCYLRNNTPLSGIGAKRGSTCSARKNVPGHGNANDEKNAGKKVLLEPARGLHETDHDLGNSRSRKVDYKAGVGRPLAITSEPTIRARRLLQQWKSQFVSFRIRAESVSEE